MPAAEDSEDNSETVRVRAVFREQDPEEAQKLEETTAKVIADEEPVTAEATDEEEKTPTKQSKNPGSDSDDCLSPTSRAVCRDLVEGIYEGNL